MKKSEIVILSIASSLALVCLGMVIYLESIGINLIDLIKITNPLIFLRI